MFVDVDTPVTIISSRQPTITEFAEPGLRIHLLGTPDVTWSRQPVALARRQSRALLYRLVVSPQPVPRDELCFLFWPDIGETTARRNLTVLLNHLRRELPLPNIVMTVDDTIDLHRGAVWTDTMAFEAASHAALRERAIDGLRDAVDLYRGPFLHGFALPASAEFETWMTQERQGWERRYLETLAVLIEVHIAASDYRSAIDVAQRYLVTDDRAEEIHRRLIWLYAASGDRAAALQQFDHCTDVLEREFNLSPAAETWAIFEAMRDGKFKVENDSSLIVASALPMPRHAPLPTPLNPLIGRADEVAAVCVQLSEEGVRLLTLTGPGGSGKTRLALQIAADLRDSFTHGVAFVSLASLRDPALVMDAIARACGLHETSHHRLADELCDYLRDKHVLLVLDNFEHLLPAATTVADILAAAPRLHVMITSRASLHLSGEHVFPVPPLPLPDPAQILDVEALAGQPAVKLLLARAQSHNSKFQITSDNAADLAAICVKLDGLPLAIELAAARLKVLSPSALLQRLDDRLSLLTDGPRDLPLRQQMLRATIDWSYQLLERDHQVLFEHLAIFAGGWTLEAAEAVVSGQGSVAGHENPPTTDHRPPTTHVLDGLTCLLNNSLIHQETTPDGETRFMMLETIREFALERLKASGEAEAVQHMHAAHYLALTEEANLSQLRPERQMWLERVESEHDNLRAALEWSVQVNIEASLSLATALWPMWYLRGHLSEGRIWLERVLALCQSAAAETYARLRAKVLHGASSLTWAQGDYAAARASAEESLALFKALKDKKGCAELLCILGYIVNAQGDRRLANSLLQQSLAIGRALDDAQIVAIALSNLGGVAVNGGEYERATTLFEKSLELFRELGDKGGIAQALYMLGDVAHYRSDHSLSAGRFKESLALYREMGNRRGAAWLLNKLGEVAQYQGDYARAMALYEESLALFRELGTREGIALVLHNLGYEALQAGNLVRANSLHQESLALFQGAGIKWGVGLALGLLGVVANVRGDYHEAADLLQQSVRIWRELESKRGIAMTLNRLGEVAVNRGESCQGLTLYRESLLLAQELDDRSGIASGLAGVAAAISAQGEPTLGSVSFGCSFGERAACLFGAAEALREEAGVLLRQVERSHIERVVAAVRAQLDDAAFFAAWAEGRAMSLEQAVTEALEEGALESAC